MSYLTEAVLLLGTASTVNLSFAYAGMIYIEPCLPCNMGYLLIPECRFQKDWFYASRPMLSYIVKAVIVGVNAIMARFCFSGFIMDAVGVGTLQCHCIRNMLIQTKRLIIVMRT